MCEEVRALPSANFLAGFAELYNICRTSGLSGNGHMKRKTKNPWQEITINVFWVGILLAGMKAEDADAALHGKRIQQGCFFVERFFFLVRPG